MDNQVNQPKSHKPKFARCVNSMADVLHSNFIHTTHIHIIFNILFNSHEASSDSNVALEQPDGD